MATIHRYKDDRGWYFKDDAGFRRYPIRPAGQALVDAAYLADGATIPREVARELRLHHLYRRKRKNENYLPPPATWAED